MTNHSREAVLRSRQNKDQGPSERGVPDQLKTGSRAGVLKWSTPDEQLASGCAPFTVERELVEARRRVPFPHRRRANRVEEMLPAVPVGGTVVRETGGGKKKTKRVFAIV